MCKWTTAMLGSERNAQLYKDQTWWIEEPFQSKANQSEVLSLLKKLAVLDFSPHIRFEKASFEEPLLDVRYRYGAKEGHWVLGVLEPQKNAYPLKVEHSSQIQEDLRLIRFTLKRFFYPPRLILALKTK
jgi:hypothetical protein